MCIFIYVYISLSLYIYIYICTCKTYIYIYTYIHIYVYIYIYIYIYIIYIYIYIYTYTYTHKDAALKLPRSGQAPGRRLSILTGLQTWKWAASCRLFMSTRTGVYMYIGCYTRITCCTCGTWAVEQREQTDRQELPRHDNTEDHERKQRGDGRVGAFCHRYRRLRNKRPLWTREFGDSFSDWLPRPQTKHEARVEHMVCWLVGADTWLDLLHQLSCIPRCSSSKCLFANCTSPAGIYFADTCIIIIYIYIYICMC